MSESYPHTPIGRSLHSPSISHSRKNKKRQPHTITTSQKTKDFMDNLSQNLADNPTFIIPLDKPVCLLIIKSPFLHYGQW